MDDKQFGGNSLKLNGRKGSETVRARSVLSPNLKEDDDVQVNGRDKKAKEIYKRIPEDNLHKYEHPIKDQKSITKTEQTTLNGESKMVQENNLVNDGADEQMLGANDNDKLAEKRDEVKFIKNDHQNGDAKIDIGSGHAKAFSGMTKEELMMYANDPFWIRLRWIFFILFWGVWIAMLIGAILIIYNAPKCAAPTPLAWYKQGPLIKFQSNEAYPTDVDLAKRVRATGAIYELPPEDTYSVKESKIEEKIKAITSKYKDSGIDVVLDITPNYVNKQSRLMQDALSDKNKRSAFIWIEQPNVPNNWLSIVNGSAWSEVQPSHFVLSQFHDGLYDLHMNDSIVKKELSDTLLHLLHLGVKGFRFKNTKFFLISKDIQNEEPNGDPKYIHTQYGFWTHGRTTFQEGLGDVLYEYLSLVKNFSSDAFLSVSEDIIRPESYQTKGGELGIELPIYGRFAHSLSSPKGKNLHKELQNTLNSVGKDAWLQWNCEEVNSSVVDPSAFALFLSLLPGVPVVPSNSHILKNVSIAVMEHIDDLRSSPSYMHGSFDVLTSGEIIAYSRIKSGNPGYFVAFNPTEFEQTTNFTGKGLPDKMTVDIISENYNATGFQAKSKVMTDAVIVSSYSTIVLTYVPVKSG